jgi:acyl-CoA reductase-like NAD-dependent aldehyde dehydrogenase
MHEHCPTEKLIELGRAPRSPEAPAVNSIAGRAHRVGRKLCAGSAWVNYWNGGDMTAPFGGYKQSGNGRDKSLHAFEKYTEINATQINLAT